MRFASVKWFSISAQISCSSKTNETLRPGTHNRLSLANFTLLTCNGAPVATLGSLTNAAPTELVTVQTDNFIPNTSTNAKEACRDIHCDFEATCELGPDNFPRCTCKFDCASAALANPVSTKPVCASDLRIYPSICAMKMEACQRQEELRLRPLELCQGLINWVLLPPLYLLSRCGNRARTQT